jgi:uncharacterized RDD family membrane protein YckC
MTCPICGKAYPCAHGPAAHSRATAAREQGNSALLLDHQNATGEPEGPLAGQDGAADSQEWRQEVASRVQQHRARRRRHTDRNALELDFSANEPFSFSAQPQRSMPPPPERFTEIMVRTEPPKVIRFPRPTPVPLPAMQEITLDELELAAPVPETPRIVEAPEAEAEPAEAEPSAVVMEAEQMELLPSFADIELEPAPSRLVDELDLIPQAAPLEQRLMAGLVDAAIVLAGSGVCTLTFYRMAEEMPHSRLTIAFALAACGMFWLLFQYLFLIYGRTTPGMQMAQLELCTFEGKKAPLFARRSRALAGALSGCAAGLGYAWAFIDEDRLGWHDRISQTHLRVAVSSQQSAFSSQHSAFSPEAE